MYIQLCTTTVDTLDSITVHCFDTFSCDVPGASQPEGRKLDPGIAQSHAVKIHDTRTSRKQLARSLTTTLFSIHSILNHFNRIGSS